MSRPINKRSTENGLYEGPDNALLKILFWNAGGLTNDKFVELKHLIIKNNIDIYGVVEAGAASVNIEYFQLRGYQYHVLERSRQVASGILVGVSDKIISKATIRKTMTSNDKMEALEVEVWKNGTNRKFFFIYNPPNNQPDLQWLETLWDSRTVVIGDFNAHSNRWGYNDTNAAGNCIEEFIDSNPASFIENTLSQPTFLSYRGSTSHPDLIWVHTRLAPHCQHTLIHPPGGAGHKILLLNMQSGLKPQRSEAQIKWNLRKANWTKFKKLTDGLLKITIVNENEIDLSYERIKKCIISCAKESIPRGKVKGYTPFWSENIQKLKEDRDRAREHAENTGAPRACENLRAKHAILKKNIIQAKRTAFRNFISGIDFRKDGIKAHKFVSNLNNQCSTTKSPMQAGSRTLTSNKDIANYFCASFAKVSNFTPNKNIKRLSNKEITTCCNQGEYEIMNECFSIDELETAMKAMKVGKSPGPDEILTEHLLNLSNPGKKTILKFINAVWLNYFPTDWKKAVIIPIPKNGKTTDQLQNFRPIALTSSFCKLMERMIVRRLNAYLDKNGLISKSQGGFRKFRSTTAQVAHLTNWIKDGFNRKQSTLAVFVDFSTAFDRVCRKLLINKLLKIGVHGKLINAIKSFLSQRFISVKYNGYTSKYKQTRQGLPQGSVLSPILFTIMIDDLEQELCKECGLNVLLYADDIVMWATSSNITALEAHMNKALSLLAAWANENEMRVNTTKTVAQLFSLSTKKPDINLNYMGQPLINTEEAVYLGVKLDTRLTWSKHAAYVTDKGNKRLTLLNRLTATTWGANQDVLVTTYKSYVRPVIEYGQELLITAKPSAVKGVDLTQNKALRIITGAPKSTPIAAMQLQTGLEPCSIRREKAAVLLHEKNKRIPNSHWVKYKPASTRLKTQSNFSTVVEDLAEKCGLPHDNVAPLYETVNYTGKKASFSLRLINLDGKRGESPQVLRQFALETLDEWYPTTLWTHVYTDGSARGTVWDAGAGVYSKNFQLSIAVGKHATSFDGEIGAIRAAIEEIIKRKQFDKHLVFLVDSRAAILAVVGESKAPDVIACQIAINKVLETGRKVVLQWVPAHCGLQGNERADKLAKQGSAQVQPQPPLPLHSSHRIVKTFYKEKVKTNLTEKARGHEWETLCTEDGRLPRDLERGESVARFRMLTGHDYLNKHLKRIGLSNESACCLCSTAEMTGEHLLKCPKLKDDIENFKKNGLSIKQIQVKLYWATRRRMMEISKTGIG